MSSDWTPSLSGAGPSWGNLVVTYTGSSPLTLEWLVIKFKSPSDPNTSPLTSSSLNPQPWLEVTSYFDNEPIEGDPYALSIVTAFLSFPGGQTIKQNQAFSFGMSGNLAPTQDPDYFTKSVTVSISVGTVNVQCAPAPKDTPFDNYTLFLTFNMGKVALPFAVPLNATTPCTVPASSVPYNVTAFPLLGLQQTITAAAQLSSSTVTVPAGQSVSLTIASFQVSQYSELDVTIDPVQGLQGQTFSGNVLDTSTNKPFTSFQIPVDGNYTARLPQVPSGNYSVSIDPVIVNNNRYSYPAQSVTTSPPTPTPPVIFSKPSSEPIVTTGAQVSIQVINSPTLSADVLLHLVGTNSRNYSQIVPAKDGTTIIKVVDAGDYKVQASNFIDDYTVYIVSVVGGPTLTVPSTGTATLQLQIESSANLKVPGFPTFLGFGGCALDVNPGPKNPDLPYFVEARASSIFKYAYDGGAGTRKDWPVTNDQGVWDESTADTIQLARAVGDNVTPVMVVYTCVLSGGGVGGLSDDDQLKYRFGDLIYFLQQANQFIDTDHSTPATFILNPDFLGECQKEKVDPTNPNQTTVHVNETLGEALDHYYPSSGSTPRPTPPTFDETLSGYVQAVNWVMRTVGPAISFGWQVNLWAVGSANWVYNGDPVATANSVATYVGQASVFDRTNLPTGTNPPDFLVIDRSEVDDFATRGYQTGYTFGPGEWGRYFDYCQALSENLKVPVMPWQIPASHTPLVTDVVTSDFLTTQYWGSGGTYVFGSPNLNFDINNINYRILSMLPPYLVDVFGKSTSMQTLFANAEPFDQTKPAYLDFPQRGIFAVLLGGGTTTGLVPLDGLPLPDPYSQWARDRVKAYMDGGPISLASTPPPAANSGN